MASPARVDATYVTLANWKGQVFRAAVATRKQLAKLDANQRTLVENLRALQSRLSRGYTLGTTDETTLQRVAEQRLALEEQLRRSLGFTGTDWVDLDELSTALPAGSVLVDFYLHGRSDTPDRPLRASAWVLHAGAKHVEHVDLGPVLALRERVRMFLASIVTSRGDTGRSPGRPTGRRPRVRPAHAAAGLRQALWNPLREKVGDAKLVFVSPDVFLAQVPLEILTDDDGRFLIEKHGFVYVQDVGEITHRHTRPAAAVTPRLLAVGAVDYSVSVRDKTRGSAPRQWPPLPETGPEVDGVARLFRQRFTGGTAKLLRGADATETALKAALPGATVVHLATHGFFAPSPDPAAARSAGASARVLDERFPGLRAGVVLAAGDSTRPGGDDGVLTAEEAAWAELGACDLVVLSACESGLGEARHNEGLMSVRRAFLEAGARTVVSSLWQVGDDSAKELMLEFYKRLWSGRVGKLEALRGAQLALLKRNRNAHRDARPRTWGAFVLSGDWR